MKINGETKIIGFFGSTYKTSKMYGIYNFAFDKLNLNYKYLPFVVKDLKKAVEGIRNLGIHAVGITIPYKISIIPYLDELDKDAERIGAVNVVINQNGKLIGGNTDGQGAVKALMENDIDLSGKRVAILGAGGAARAIAFAVHDAGGILSIVNRTKQKAKELAEVVDEKASFFSMEDLGKVLSYAEIIINTTPMGMAGTDFENITPVDKTLLNKNMVIMDIITNPKETRLLQEAKSVGCEVVYGERMLLWQGILKFKYYTGVEPPVEVMENTLT
jgi:shikimate dehydrogenase